MNREYLNRIIQRISGSVTYLSRGVKPSDSIPTEDQLLIGEGKGISAAILFIDICKFTSWQSSSHVDQKNVLMILNMFFTEMVRIVKDHNGYVEKNTGDGLMAYFSEESDLQGNKSCDKAIEAAITMNYVTENILNPYFERNSLRQVSFKSSIDYGPITIAKVGAPYQFNANVAIGISANIACKMLKDAGENDVIIGKDVYDRIGTSFKNYCSLLKENTGFTVRDKCGNINPYPFYKMTGRWRHPNG